MNSHLLTVDFAALETLKLVHKRMSFTQAAAELNVKQSSVSYTIGKLRQAFSDPLFVRQGAGIAATERCIEIVEAANRILSEADRAATPAEFDPAASTASVTISATYLARSVLLPRVVQEIRREAPGISVELITGFTAAREHLLTARSDLALTPVTIEESGIYGQTLFSAPYACLMDRENPLTVGELTPERFAAARHLVIHYGELWRPMHLAPLEKMGFKVDVALSTPDPADVGYLIAGTDLVVGMPGYICRQFAGDLYICPCPLPVSVDVHMYWPARLNRSPIQTWLREKIARVAGELADVRPGPAAG